MAREIEHKFLVKPGAWQPSDAGTGYRQGYLSSVKERVVRVRTAGAKGYLTVKGITRGLSRLEFEYEIPLADANRMLDELCERPLVEKTRHKERHGAHVWEIDVFHGENDGLVLAEIEVASESERFEVPAWAGTEVSSDPRYFSSNLGTNPYRNWKPENGRRRQ